MIKFMKLTIFIQKVTEKPWRMMVKFMKLTIKIRKAAKSYRDYGTFPHFFLIHCSHVLQIISKMATKSNAETQTTSEWPQYGLIRRGITRYSAMEEVRDLIKAKYPEENQLQLFYLTVQYSVSFEALAYIHEFISGTLMPFQGRITISLTSDRKKHQQMTFRTVNNTPGNPNLVIQGALALETAQAWQAAQDPQPLAIEASASNRDTMVRFIGDFIHFLSERLDNHHGMYSIRI